MLWGNGGIELEQFWYFLLYSFCGFALEKGFAWLAHHPKRDRKCLLVLPLCPVYGLGALAVLALAGDGGSLRVMVAGILGGTGTELAVGAFCRYVLGVEFWSYRGVPGNVAGLICPRFSAAWAGLALVLVYGVHPLAAQAVSRLPEGLGAVAAVVTGSDLLVSAAALRRTGNTDVLRWWEGEDQVPGGGTKS